MAIILNVRALDRTPLRIANTKISFSNPTAVDITIPRVRDDLQRFVGRYIIDPGVVAPTNVTLGLGGTGPALTVTNNDTGATTATNISNAGTGQALKITQTGITSASTSTGGAVNITNSSNTGPGLVVFSSQASPAGRLFVVNASNAGFNQSAAFITSAGTGKALEITNTGTGIALNVTGAGGATTNQHASAISLTGTGSTNSSALSISSTNLASSCIQVTGTETGRGTIKITHTGQSDASDANASAISIDLQTAGTAAQGIFLDATTGATTGNLLEFRNNGVNKFRVMAGGQLVASSAGTSAPSTGNQWNGSLTFWLDEAGNNLKVQVKYSGGTVKTATVALV